MIPLLSGLINRWSKPICTRPTLLKTSCDRMDPIRKTSGFAYGPLINPPPSLSKISYKYNSMLTYTPVSFLFSFIFRVWVRVKNRVRVF